MSDPVLQSAPYRAVPPAHLRLGRFTGVIAGPWHLAQGSAIHPLERKTADTPVSLRRSAPKQAGPSDAERLEELGQAHVARIRRRAGLGRREHG